MNWNCPHCGGLIPEECECPEPTPEEIFAQLDALDQLAEEFCERLREEELFREFEQAMEVAASKLAQYQEFHVPDE